MNTENGDAGNAGMGEGKDTGRRQRPRRYKEVDIDWSGISEDLARARPKQISEKEALERIAEELVAQHRRGITAEQMAEILGRRGLAVDVGKVSEVLRDFGSRGAGEGDG